MICIYDMFERSSWATLSNLSSTDMSKMDGQMMPRHFFFPDMFFALLLDTCLYTSGEYGST